MQNNRQAVLIWDLPTRLFHWALVVCIVGAFVTVKLGGLYMDWHIRFGCATLGLLLFRLIWASSARAMRVSASSCAAPRPWPAT